MIPAPGHYVGHSAVVARSEDITYLFSGDAGYTFEDMLAGRTDGVTNILRSHCRRSTKSGNPPGWSRRTS